MALSSPEVSPGDIPPLADQDDPNGTWRATPLEPGVGHLDWQPAIEDAPPVHPVHDQRHDTGSWWVGAGGYATWRPTEPPDPSEPNPKG